MRVNLTFVAVVSLGIFSLTARPTAAQTNLTGQSVNVARNNSTGFSQDVGTQIVTASGVTYNYNNAVAVRVDGTTVTFTNTFGLPLGFVNIPFNGFLLTETGLAPTTITGAVEDPSTNATGFGPGDGRISFTNNSLSVNFANTPFNVGDVVKVDLTFPAAAPPVPEPGSVALLTGLTLTGAAFLRRRKQASRNA